MASLWVGSFSLLIGYNSDLLICGKTCSDDGVAVAWQGHIARFLVPWRQVSGLGPLGDRLLACCCFSHSSPFGDEAPWP